MLSAMSVDLRERVVAVIDAGASRLRTAQHFGVGTTNAICCHLCFVREGRVTSGLWVATASNSVWKRRRR